MTWLRDRRARIHVLGLTMLVGGFLASVVLGAQGSQNQVGLSIEKPSMIDKWLTPDVVIGSVLVLMYVGELRGDLGRIKEEQGEARKWRESLHAELRRDFMGREAAEARFEMAANQTAALERRIG